MTHTLYILGSGQDGGLPQLGARGARDAAARKYEDARRLGPSVAILAGDGRCFLVDASPDIREQETRLLRVPAYAARRAASPFDGVLLTHAHMGHYLGLAHFGREAAATRELPVWCSARMAGFLEGNAPWSLLVSARHILPRVLLPGQDCEPWPGLRLRVMAVPHRGEYTDTLAVSINDELLYVPDIDDWRMWPAAREEVARHRVCLLDGTFYSADELPGRDLAEVPHPLITDTLEFFADLARGRRLILTHLNHSNPVCDGGSPEARRVLAAGFGLAEEMQAIALTT
jgi:pyrroloquinoline quinone biosynthesis protein B